MKTTIYTFLVLLLSTAITVHAQQAANRPKEAREKTEARVLKQQFTLTDAQTAQCEQIIKKYTAQLAVAKPAKTDSLKHEKNLQKLVKQRNEELKAVFNPAQKTKFDKWQQDKKSHNGKAIK